MIGQTIGELFTAEIGRIGQPNAPASSAAPADADAALPGGIAFDYTPDPSNPMFAIPGIDAAISGGVVPREQLASGARMTAAFNADGTPDLTSLAYEIPGRATPLYINRDFSWVTPSASYQATATGGALDGQSVEARDSSTPMIYSFGGRYYVYAHDPGSNEITPLFIQARVISQTEMDLRGDVSIVADVTPGVGTAKMIGELVSGRDAFTGQKIDRKDYAIGAAASLLVGATAGKALSKALVARAVIRETTEGLDQATIDRIVSIPMGTRPDPSGYMPVAQINAQLAEFDTGASRFTLQSRLAKYGPAQVDGTTFVMPASQADDLLASTRGDSRALEQALGLPEGALDGDQLVRLDISNPRDLNLRIPSGNEAGTNPQWIPGGRLPNGNLEAVVDLGGIPTGRYTVSPITVWPNLP